MALLRPILNPTVAFDADNQHTFTFSTTGSSSQIVANMLTIRNNETNDIVYQEKQETFKYEHIVNAEELTNGVYYNATVVVYDADDNASPESIPIQFWCYTTPTLTFTNVPTGNIITNPSFTFEFTYTQAENEAINSYTVILYNSSQIPISTSDVQYAIEGTPPYNGSYTFTGFENSTVYYIEVSGATVEGTLISTGLQQFTVQYTKPDLFTLVELNNNCDEGYITLISHIVLIVGESNPDPPKYINNQEVDVTGNGEYVEWNQGFNISGDILAGLWFRNPNDYSTIAQFSNIMGQQFTLRYMLGYENLEATDLEAYMELEVSSYSGAHYFIYSNYIAPIDESTGDHYVVYLRRIDNIYQLQLLTAT